MSPLIKMNKIVQPPTGFTLLEVLEPRIAPATLVAGGTGKDFSSAEFVSTASPAADSAISAFFGPSSSGHYYIALNQGDVIKFDNDGNAATAAQDWLQVKGGKAIAFFLDDGDGKIEKNELVGLSIGGSSSVSINGDVNGSILTNLDGIKGKFLGNTLGDGSKNFITDLNVAGNITGSVLSGGNILKMTVGGSVSDIRAGTAAIDISFGLGGGVGIAKGKVLAFEMPVGKTGAGISNVIIHGDVSSVLAGDGGMSAAGGNISTVTVYGDANLIAAGNGGISAPGGNVFTIKVLTNKDGLAISAGVGGSGIDSHLNGGAGGKISGVDIRSTANGLPYESTIQIRGGEGGAGWSGESDSQVGNGGIGGSVDNISIGAFYDTKTKSWQPYAQEFFTEHNVTIMSGNGGSGNIAGNGGAVTTASVFAKNAVIQITGGDGGWAYESKSSKVGHGGAISNIFAISQDTDSVNSLVELLGGSAGKYDRGDINTNAGGNGGSITNILGIGGITVRIAGGAASDGSVGGNGGQIAKIVANTTLARIANFEILGGDGGNSVTGNGGNGGAIGGVVLGAVFNTRNNAWNPLAEEFIPVNIVLTTGNGGSGKIGGSGGAAVNSALFGKDLLYISSGHGGDSTGLLGGNGGEIRGIASLTNTNYSEIAAGRGGNGGNGGNMGRGGTGASISDVNIASKQVILTAGAGGAGTSGGAGGSISKVNANSAFASMGELQITAGNGGEGTLKTGGTGGNISNFNADNSQFLNQLAVPTGNWWENGYNLHVQAGNGGAGVSSGGNGGSLLGSNFQMDAIESQEPSLPAIIMSAKAGAGGAANGEMSKGGNGGTISNSSFQSSNNVRFDEFSVTAGTGGDGTGAKSSGGKGGSILTSLIQSESFVSISAGNGGFAENTGGAGGSILSGLFSAFGLSITAGDAGGTSGAAGGSITGNEVGFGSAGLTLRAGNGDEGGSIQTLKIKSADNGGIDISAGDAYGETKSSNGGSVRNIEIQYQAGTVSNYVSIVAGNADAGGNGGSIENIRDKVSLSPDQGFVPAPYNLIIKAGNGANDEKIGGNGGSIKKVKLVAPGEWYAFSFIAGNGGTGEKGGNGGSIEEVSLLSQTTAYDIASIGGKQVEHPTKVSFQQGTPLGEVDLVTGHGGDSSVAAIGAKGGDAKNVSWNIDNLVRALTLGLGGTGQTTNGADGKAISVNPDPKTGSESSYEGTTTTLGGLNLSGGNSYGGVTLVSSGTLVLTGTTTIITAIQSVGWPQNNSTGILTVAGAGGSILSLDGTTSWQPET